MVKKVAIMSVVLVLVSVLVIVAGCTSANRNSNPVDAKSLNQR